MRIPMVLSRLFGSRSNDPFPPPQPEEVVDIVGDLHGRADLLSALPAPEAGVPRIFVGDTIDRGPDSRAVLYQMRAHEEARLGVCLMGNHEEMMLGFLDNPVERGPSWLRNGGRQTLASFGVVLDSAVPDADALMRTRDTFRAALGPDLEAWLHARPVLWRSGTLVVAHAGADPTLSIEKQPAHALLWGSRDFATRPRRDGIWIAHGHTIHDQPHAERGRIAVDTGAYATGRLSMARVHPDGAIGFVTVTAG